MTGTPAYLSPESALGEPVDRRTDIYALGCVAYWMLTGRYVFTGDSAMQIVARHMSSGAGAAVAAQRVRCVARAGPGGARLSREEAVGPPGSARELCDRLGQCEVEGQWTREDARAWWETRMEPEKDVALG